VPSGPSARTNAGGASAICPAKRIDAGRSTNALDAKQ
jgi:hypothetical protein